jgi:hypothetical protein
MCMPTRPPSPDPSSAQGHADAPNPFASLGAGMGFFQDWMKAAGSALPHLSGHTGGTTSGMPSWSLPTLDPEELDKRIQDLKTVQFWLEQNARMIGMTIQGLEVQRMTLSTLKGMNVSMEAVRDAMTAKAPAPAAQAPEPPPPPPPPPAPAPSPAASTDAGAEPGSELINPMRWWDTLTQQFTHLASQAATVPASLAAAASGASTPAKASGKSAKSSSAGKTAPARKRAKTPAARKTRGSAQAD